MLASGPNQQYREGEGVERYVYIVYILDIFGKIRWTGREEQREDKK